MAVTSTKVKHKATATTSDSMLAPIAKPNPPTHEQIRERAYQIFDARQGEHGNPVVDWLKAEHELLSWKSMLV